MPLTAVPISRIFNNTDFGYQTITVERPERDAAGKIVKETKGKGKGKPKPDPSLRDTENVPLSDSVEDYFKREVLPHVPDAWIDHEKTNPRLAPCGSLERRTALISADVTGKIDVREFAPVSGRMSTVAVASHVRSADHADRNNSFGTRHVPATFDLAQVQFTDLLSPEIKPAFSGEFP